MNNLKGLRILAVSDDGVYDKGFKFLVSSLRSAGADVVGTAPLNNMSAMGHALTTRHPVKIKVLEPDKMYAVDGTPADAVYLALNGFLNVLPDMVISGINSVFNLGDDVLSSGTVGAAMEGRGLTYPAVALSLGGCTNYISAWLCLMRVLKKIDMFNMPYGGCLNINVPDVPVERIKGLAVTVLCRRSRGGETRLVDRHDGEITMEIGKQFPPEISKQGTDYWAVEHEYASVTPITSDFTLKESLSGFSF